MTNLSRSFIEFGHRFVAWAAGTQYRAAARWLEGWWPRNRSRLIENDDIRSPP